jgi:hypothetical protein
LERLGYIPEQAAYCLAQIRHIKEVRHDEFEDVG